MAANFKSDIFSKNRRLQFAKKMSERYRVRLWEERANIIAVLTLTIVVAGGLCLHLGSILNFLYSPLCLWVGMFLFVRSPAAHYLSFSLWVWFLTPLVRRIVDLQSGWHTISLVMMAPLLVSGLTIITCFVHHRRLLAKPFLPLLVIIGVLIYGALVGIVQAGLNASVFTFLNWLVPICTAIHIMIYAERENVMGKSIINTMIWAALVTGAYGLYQFFQPPEWDKFWMTASQFTSGGSAEKEQLRLFSTLNSPGPFAFCLGACIIALLGGKQKIRWVAAPLALASFILTLGRTAWLGFLISFSVMLLRGSKTFKFRLLISAIIVAIVAIPLVSVGPIANAFKTRMGTFSNLETDDSYKSRKEFYSSFFAVALSNVGGKGLGTTGLGSRLSNDDGSLGEYGIFDSGIMDLLFTFGYSSVLLVGSIAYLLFFGFFSSKYSDYGKIGFAITLGSLSQLLSSNILYGVTGMFVFPMLGLALCHWVEVDMHSKLRKPRIKRSAKVATAQKI